MVDRVLRLPQLRTLGSLQGASEHQAVEDGLQLISHHVDFSRGGVSSTLWSAGGVDCQIEEIALAPRLAKVDCLVYPVAQAGGGGGRIEKRNSIKRTSTDVTEIP